MKTWPTAPLLLLLAACGGDGNETGDTNTGTTDTTTDTNCEPPFEDTGTQIGTIDDSCVCEEPVLIAGSNEFPEDWAPLTEGGEVTVVHGPQGGWHIWASAKALNTRNVVEISIDIWDIPSGVKIAANDYHVAVIKEDTCAGYYPGMFAFVNVTELIDGELNTPPELICYHPLRMEVGLTDSGGRSLTQSFEVLAAPDPADVGDCVIDEHSTPPEGWDETTDTGTGSTTDTGATTSG